jgi:predicted hydrocarbon binding protein
VSGNITLPAASFAVLATGLSGAGTQADSVLGEAGRTTGRALAAGIVGDEDTGLSSRRFWETAGESVREAGLGSIGVESTGEAWIILVGVELAEPEPYAFTAGVIEGLLSAAAGEPVGVVASPGDELCRFVAAAPRLLAGVERLLQGGAALEDALRGDAGSG